jgi:hypothetical protein
VLNTTVHLDPAERLGATERAPRAAARANYWFCMTHLFDAFYALGPHRSWQCRQREQKKGPKALQGVEMVYFGVYRKEREIADATPPD